MSGSAHFEIDGPLGHLSLPADSAGAASFVAGKPGTYTATVIWREENGCAVTVDASVGPRAFDVSPGEAPTTSFRTVRSPRRANSRGEATLVGYIRCPRLPTLLPTRIAVYYERGTKTPTHASPHLVLDVAEGCGAGVGVATKRRSGKGYGLSLNRGGAAIRVAAPQRMRVLVELSYGGRLLGSARAAFRPGPTGESIKRT